MTATKPKPLSYHQIVSLFEELKNSKRNPIRFLTCYDELQTALPSFQAAAGDQYGFTCKAVEDLLRRLEPERQVFLDEYIGNGIKA